MENVEMGSQIEFVEDGTVTTPQKFLAGATFAGMKTYREDKLDLGILTSETICTAAAVFTTNKIRSPSVTLSQETLGKAKARALVANSGIANACVGEQGLQDAQEVVSATASHLGLTPEEVLICSTGIIGVELPMALIRAAIPKINLSSDGGHSLARAILTTDNHAKEAAVKFKLDGTKVTIGGVAKGSGMIHPNMATVLVFLTTDAAVEESFLSTSLKESVDDTFNMLTVDGDTSTNDTVLLFANSASGIKPLKAGSPGATVFQNALNVLCEHLTKELARDAEGAEKIFSVTIRGARTQKEARIAARTVANSSLVKTAVHGNDPNWGRIVAALGRSGADVEESALELYINDVCIMQHGVPIPFFKDAVIAIMNNPEVSIDVDLNLGDGIAKAWGCDLSEEYVTFNSAYTT